MSIKCCYGCVAPKRHTGCWDHCPDYAKEKEQDKKEKAAYRQKRAVEQGITSQKYDGVYRAIKKRRK